MDPWKPIDSAPLDRVIWIIDKNAPQPGAHLGRYENPKFTRHATWVILPGKSRIGGCMPTPTHWKYVDLPEIKDGP